MNLKRFYMKIIERFLLKHKGEKKMRILDFILSAVLIGFILAAFISTPINLPHKVVQKYNGYVVTGKDRVWLLNTMNIATDDSTGSFFVSDLVYQTWAIGDTIR